MNSERRVEMLRKIESNISKHGHHITLVSQGETPRFAYSIGASKSIGAELVLAGGIQFSAVKVGEIMNGLIKVLTSTRRLDAVAIDIVPFGKFTLKNVHRTWWQEMLLGVMDYYQIEEVVAYQIVPDKLHSTLDIPDMSAPLEADSSRLWRYLVAQWDYPFPPEWRVVTNLPALQGEPITELCRWEEGYWEMFAGPGPDVPKDQARQVPIHMLLAIDPSLEVALNIPVGSGLWREAPGSTWNEWGGTK